MLDLTCWRGLGVGCRVRPCACLERTVAHWSWNHLFSHDASHQLCSRSLSLSLDGCWLLTDCSRTPSNTDPTPDFPMLAIACRNHSRTRLMGPPGIWMLNWCTYMSLAALSVDQAITTRLGQTCPQKRKHWSYPCWERVPLLSVICATCR